MADSKKQIRTCRMCKNTYRYCNCEEYKHLPPFMLAFCSENCNDIDIILSNWGAKVIDSQTAYELIKSKDVSRYEFWGKSFRDAYDQILEESGHSKKSTDSSPTPAEAPKPEKPLSVSEELKEEAKKNAAAKKPRTAKKIEMPVGDK